MKRILTCLLLSFLFLNLYAAKKVSPPRQKFISCALELKGTPYRLGGQKPEEGLDCSGFVNYVNKTALENKVVFPRRAQDIYNSLVHIEKKQREPGDLVFFSDTKNGPIFHVGIYCGVYKGPEKKLNGKRVFVSALSQGEGCVKISLMDEGYWTKYHPVYARFLRTTDDFYANEKEEKKQAKEKQKQEMAERRKTRRTKASTSVY
ncbi:MAG: C40 family peptidase [Treponema sp.]|nr:C40 family peptidase [Candidatus Treponema equi]